MHLTRISAVLSVMPVGLVLFACGGNASRTGPLGGSDGGICTVPAGSFTQRLTAKENAAECGTVSESHFTRSSYDEPSASGTYTSDNDGGSQNCTWTTDGTTCTETSICDVSTADSKNHSVWSVTRDPTGAGHGTVTETITRSSGGTRSCTYDVTITRD